MVWFAPNQGSTAFSLPFTIEDMLAEKKRENEPVDIESEQEEIEQLFPEHEEWCRRFHKTLYYGGKSGSLAANKMASSRISLPVTELCVESFASATELVAAAASSSSAILAGGASMVPLSGITMARAAEVTRGVTGASPTSLVLALLYLDRLRTKNSGYLHSVSSADLFLVSLLVASKYLHDDGEEDEVFNDEWAEVGGLEKLELKRLELGFLSALDWEAYVGPKQFVAMAEKLECAVALRQLASPLRRKSNAATTYTEVCILSRNPGMIRLAMETLALCSVKVIAVCMTAYAASAVLLFGTACLLNRTSFGPNAFHSSMSTLMSTTASSDLQTPTSSSEVIAVEGVDQDDEANSTSAIHFLLRDSIENGVTEPAVTTLWGASSMSSPQSDLNHHSTSVLISPDGKNSFLSSSLSLLNLWHKQVKRGWRSWGKASQRPSSQCPWSDFQSTSGFRIAPWFLPEYSQTSSVLLYGVV